MTVRIYNTLTQNVDEVKGRGLNPRNINMYVCGPTVYDSPHVGHARSYIFFDVLKRTLLLDGYRVKHLQNFSDVDEKIDNMARKEGIRPDQVSRKYASEFIKDMDTLNVVKPDYYIWTSDEIEIMRRIALSFLDRDLVYEAGGNYYFRAGKGGGFGSLLHNSLANLISGNEADTFPFVKKDREDFTIWFGKFQRTAEGIQTGRPSWNLECFSMVHKVFGCELDIQGGGNDLIFPHHEVGSVMSKAYCHVEFANYFIHNAFVTLKQDKMSKSTNNFVPTRTLLSKFSTESIRLYMLSAHFRKNIEFSFESLRKWEEIASLLRKKGSDSGVISGSPEVWPDEAGDSTGSWQDFMNSLRNDVDTEKAVVQLSLAARNDEAFSGKEGRADFRLMCAALGLFGFRIGLG